MDDKIVAHLRTLGLSDQVIDAYAYVLGHGAVAVPAMSRALSVPLGTTRRRVEQLIRSGLAQATADDPLTVRAVYPGPALGRLAARRAAELDFAQTAVLDGVEALRRADLNTELGSFAEVIAGVDVEAQLAHAETGARRQVRSLDCPPYYAEALRERIEPANLRRGVRYRVVYAASALDRPGMLADSVAPLIRDGEDARTISTVATKLMIIDERIAFVAATTVPDSSAPVLLVRPSGLFNALVGLFEYTWRAASELDAAGGTRGSPLSGADRRLLALLAGGAADDQIARALGISRRTFFRRLERLMKLSGAMTRFELAVRASQSGWI